MTTHKTCTICGNNKLLEEFALKKSGNRCNQCSKCINKRATMKKIYMRLLNNKYRYCISCFKVQTLSEFYQLVNDNKVRYILEKRELLTNSVERHNILNPLFHNKCLTCCKNTEAYCSTCRSVKNIKKFYVQYNKPRAECMKCTANRSKTWRTTNTDYNKMKKKEYREDPKNKEHYKKYREKWYADSKNKTSVLIQTRFCNMVPEKYRSIHSMELLGCSMKHFMMWLEFQFIDDMTWENQGKWEIDHIKPCALFDFSILKEQEECFHWSNLQPLWKNNNAEKGDTYTSEIKENAIKTFNAFQAMFSDDIDPPDEDECNDILELYDDIDN